MRNPQASGYFRCVQDHFEQLEMLWQDRYAPRYGFWRPYVTVVIYHYNDAVIENILCWRHSGFNVYCGPTIWPNNDQGLEYLARYIIRACFSQERMTYLPVVTHIPNKGE